MSGSPNRRKLCQLQIQKQAYLRHITRLEELKDGRSHDQIQRNRQQKKLAHTITAVRKMHVCNREFKQKQLKQIQLQSKQTDFKKVKSVVINDFNWSMPSVAPKHQRNIKPILNQNMKLFERIINTKANVNSRNYGYTQRKNKDLPCLGSSDFSKLYQKSILSTSPSKTIKIRLGKSKQNQKAHIQVDLRQLFETLKDTGSMYLFQLMCGNLKGRSKAFILQQLQISNIILKAPENCLSNRYLNARLIKILDNHEKKQIIKARFFGDIIQKNDKKEKQLSKLRSSSSNQYKYQNQGNHGQSKDNQNQLFLKNTYKILIKLKLQKDHKFSLNASREIQNEKSQRKSIQTRNIR